MTGRTVSNLPRYSPGQLARLLGLPEPTAEQSAVISAPLRPLAVIAGAGSGKSETMAARLVWLVANGMIRPERVLGLTFTRKAAAELGERVRARLEGLRRAGVPASPARAGGTGPAGGGPVRAAPEAVGAGPGVWAGGPLDGEPVVSTYHAYAARLLADHALREALEPSMRLATPALAWQIADRAVASYTGPMDAITWTPTEVTACVLALAGELAEHLRTPREVHDVGEWLNAAEGALPGRVPAGVRKIIECQRAREQLLPIVTAYAEAKAAREVIDHGDQVRLAARIATRHPEVGAAERARYQAVLLDEYQDTSHAQLVLLRALFGGGHPVTAVGDPCQSIYGWRGASAGNLRRFATDFPAAVTVERERGGRTASRPAEVRLLATSFRNTGRVLDVAAVLQKSLREEAPEVPLLKAPPRRAGRGTVQCALLETAGDEARWVAERIEELLRLPPGTSPDGKPWPERGAVGVRPGDVAVLCRKRAQFPLLRAAIEARGIGVEVVGLGGLLTVPEVADVVATLRVLHNPTASGPLARLLTGPRWRIGPRDLVALGRRARDLAAGPQSSAVAGSQGPAAKARPTASAASAGGSGDPAGAADRPSAAGTADDPLAQAVADLTADPGSLVEALDDLGVPAAYSAEGHARLSALAAELRFLRARVGRPLPDLVGEVERVLGLDIEVAAQPWRDPAAARADLDAFADAAAAFADDREEPTLGGFLAYLTAAESEEFGLESGRPALADAVTLTTIHAAKGLQWAAVVVPGLSAGARAQVFPARPRVTTRWTENPRLLPFGLRGDAGDLPALPDLTAQSLSAFRQACTDRDLSEERRLAYVAVTRAAFWVACTGYWWGDGASPLGPSLFLEEVRKACDDGAGTVAHWAPPPPEGAQNPALAGPTPALWPQPAAGARHEAVRQAAAMVQHALAASARDSASPGAGTPGPPGDEAGADPLPEGDLPASGGADAVPLPPDEQNASRPPGGAGLLSRQEEDLARAWARDTDLLLAELAERRAGAGAAVSLPGRLSVSALVTMAADPASLAQQIRRPMPRPPAPQARRGTAFHRWLEERFGQQRLLDPADLLGAADDPDDEDASDLSALRERFEAGEWGARWPQEVEVPFETLIAGHLVRGRIDAVFADDGGGYDVVDWKTGQPPSSGGERRAVAVQLAAYRVAWAGLARVPVGQVRAAFYYVRHDLTVRPADLLDEAGLAALIDGIPVAEGAGR